MSKYDLPFLNDKKPIKTKLPKGAETKKQRNLLKTKNNDKGSVLKHTLFYLQKMGG